MSLTVTGIIQKQACKQKLPSSYQIRQPVGSKILASEIFYIINQFRQVTELEAFLKAICQRRQIIIHDGQVIWSMGTPMDLLLFFLNAKGFGNIDRQKKSTIIQFLKTQRLSATDILRKIQYIKFEQFNIIVNDWQLISAPMMLSAINRRIEYIQLDTISARFFYDFLNIENTWGLQTPYLEFDDMCSKMGHWLGLNMRFYLDNSTRSTSTERNFVKLSFKQLTRFIEQYHQENPVQGFAPILEAFSATLDLLQYDEVPYIPKAAATLFARYQQNKLTLIPVNWEEHEVFIILYQGYCIYVNRGYKALYNEGGRVYEIQSPTKIPGVINALCALDNSTSKYADFTNILNTIVDMNTPIFKLRNKPQKLGNCTAANPKAGIESMLILLSIRELSKENVISAFEVGEKLRYKRFTQFVRNTQADEIIAKSFYAKNEFLVNFYADIFRSLVLLKGVPGLRVNTIKSQQDRKRIVELHCRLPFKVRDKLHADKSFAFQYYQLQDRYRVERTIQFQPERVLLFSTPGGRGCQVKVNAANDIVSIDNEGVPKLPYSSNNVSRLIAMRKQTPH